MEGAVYAVSRIAWLFDGDRYGIPWREVFSEVLNHGQQVVVALGACDDPCYGGLLQWSKVEPGLKVLEFPEFTDTEEFSQAAMQCIAHADGEFILDLGCDEIVKMEPFLRWLKDNRSWLLDAPRAVRFHRLDFLYSKDWIAPIHEPPDQRCITQGVMRRWVPSPCFLLGDAGEFRAAQEKCIATEPIFHYHGVASEQQNIDKAYRVAKLNTSSLIACGFDPTPDKRILEGWKRWFQPGQPATRAHRFEGEHPKIMRPWLSHAEMTWRWPQYWRENTFAQEVHSE